MSHAVSVHLALLSFHINCLHYRERLPSQSNKTKKKTFLAGTAECRAQTRAASGRPRPPLRPGRAAPAGESVYHDFSKFNRPNMMSIKGDKNFNTSICSGGASKPRNLTLGVELWSWCQKMCQVSICFIRCTFLLLLVRFVLNNPRLSSLVGGERAFYSSASLQLFF